MPCISEPIQKNNQREQFLNNGAILNTIYDFEGLIFSLYLNNTLSTFKSLIFPLTVELAPS